MSWKLRLIPFFSFALLLSACAQNLSGTATEAISRAPEPAFEVEAAAEEASAFDEAASDFAFNAASPRELAPGTAQAGDGQTEQLIIRTGDIQIVVENTETTLAAITQMVEGAGGWVVSSSVFQISEGAQSGNMTVRVPAEGFQSAMEALQDMALEVRSQSTSGQDVTEEFVDLSARLGNLEATADRVRNFLDEAKNVEEALAVNQELSRLEGDIESIKGRLQYLSQSAAFSTIHIDITPDELSQPIEVGGWRPQGIVRSAIEALISTLQFLVSVLIWLILYVLPVLIIVGIPLWLIVRFVRRRRRRRAATHSAEVAPTNGAESVATVEEAAEVADVAEGTAEE